LFILTQFSSGPKHLLRWNQAILHFDDQVHNDDYGGSNNDTALFTTCAWRHTDEISVLVGTGGDQLLSNAAEAERRIHVQNDELQKDDRVFIPAWLITKLSVNWAIQSASRMDGTGLLTAYAK
jgi:hypothetical protein